MNDQTSIEQQRPWEAEGISRRTWFRRQASAKAGAPAKKPKPGATSSALTALDIAAATAAAVAPTPAEFEASLRAQAGMGLEQLRIVMLHDKSDSARVTAANMIIDRGFGKPTTDTGVDMMLPLFDQVFLKTAPGETIEAARMLAPLARTVLIKIAQGSVSGAARNAAVRSLHDRGLGLVAPARLDAYQADSKAIGKKEQALADAASAGSGTDWGSDLVPSGLSDRPN
jgi:hypothetical protein